MYPRCKYSNFKRIPFLKLFTKIRYESCRDKTIVSLLQLYNEIAIWLNLLAKFDPQSNRTASLNMIAI